MRKGLLIWFLGCCALPIFVSCVSTGAGKGYAVKKISEKNQYYTITGAYPEFEAYPEVNKRISDIILVDSDQFKTSAVSTGMESQTAMQETGSASGAMTEPFTYDVRCQPIMMNDRYINVVIQCYSYLGGPHGSTALYSVTYDKQEQKFLTVTDIDGMTYERLSELCRADLKKRFHGREEWIEDGTAPRAESFSVFTYDGKTLRIFFQQYQVAPYSEGMPEVALKMM